MGAGGGVLFSVVPLPALPKIDANGLPEMSSMAVMNMSASTNTMAAVPAMVGQENRRAGPRAGGIGVVVASRRSVAGASAAAEISRRCVSPTGAPVDCISTVSAPAPAVGLGVGRTTRITAGARRPQLAQERRRLGCPHDDLLDGLLAPFDGLGHERRAEGGDRRPDGHADDRPLDPEDRRDDRGDHRTRGGGQDLAEREFHSGISSRARAPRRRGRRTRHDSSGSPSRRRRSLPHGPVDLLAQEVGVPVVPGVLLDHVDHDPPQRKGRLLGRHRRVVEAPGGLDDGA